MLFRSVLFFNTVFSGFQIPLSIYGFQFTFWDVLLFGAVVYLVVYAVGRIING